MIKPESVFIDLSNPSHPHTPCEPFGFVELKVERIGLQKSSRTMDRSQGHHHIHTRSLMNVNVLYKQNKTFNNGSLGSRIDEERSEMR